jgi:hypothetical protein
MTCRQRVAWWRWDVEWVFSLPLVAVAPVEWRWASVMRAKVAALSARQAAEVARAGAVGGAGG